MSFCERMKSVTIILPYGLYFRRRNSPLRDYSDGLKGYLLSPRGKKRWSCSALSDQLLKAPSLPSRSLLEVIALPLRVPSEWYADNNDRTLQGLSHSQRLLISHQLDSLKKRRFAKRQNLPYRSTRQLQLDRQHV